MTNAITKFFTRSEIENLVSMRDSIAVIEDCFRLHGLGLAHNATHNFAIAKGNISMKAASVQFANGECWVGLKSLGIVNLCRAEQLRVPVAIFEQSPITFLRTAAAGAVAAKYCSQNKDTKVGILGSGRQARAQLLGLCETLNISDISVWSPTREHAEKFAQEMGRHTAATIRAVPTVRDALKDRTLLVTATRASKALFSAEWVEPGTHINAIGTDFPGNQELPSELFRNARVFADDCKQALWMGAMNVAIQSGAFCEKEITGSLGELVAKKIPARKTDGDITIFDCSGLGMMDVALAKAIYERSGDNIMGIELLS